MASITIHSIDAALNERLTQESRRRNKRFCGVWTVAEAAEFEKSQADNSRLDPEDWL